MSSSRASLPVFVSSAVTGFSMLLGTVSTAFAAVPQVPSAADLQRFIVVYRQGVGAGDIAQLQNLGSSILHQHSVIPAVSAQLSAPGLASLLGNLRVAGIYPDVQVHTFLSQSVPQIRADQVQSTGTTGQGVKVCIVDTGVSDHHPGFRTLTAQYDFVNDDADATDDNGHGTHVAGIVGSIDPTYKGVAPGADLMAAKVLDRRGAGYTSDVIAGVDWCVQNGARIISMSLGGGLYSSHCDSEPLAAAANAAVNQGVAVFAASGNDGRTNRLASPACGSKVISVGAVTKSDNVASYSNGSNQLDITAPGSSINSLDEDGSGYVTYSGTSMATPHASGVGALMLAGAPGLTPAQLEQILKNTAKDLGSAGFDTRYGFGRVDALAAVQAAQGGSFSSAASSVSSVLSISSVGSSAASSIPSSSVSSAPSSSSAASSVSSGPVTLFSDGFQSGFSQWVEENEADWNIESPAEESVPGSAGGNLVAHADQCTTTAGCILRMANALNLTGMQSASLSFWRFVDRGLDSGEFLRMEVWNGASWVMIANWTDDAGDDDEWHLETIDLTPYRSSSFRIRFLSKENSTLERTEVDDIRITGVPIPPPPPPSSSSSSVSSVSSSASSVASSSASSESSS